MGKIIIKRLLQTIPTLLVVVTLTFCLTRMLPGDPAVAILGIEANAEDIEAMRAEMNLDKSLPEQYALYLGGLVHGDFGYSYSYRQDVLPLITSRIPNTLTLTLTALLFAFIIGTSVGIIAALKQNTIFDYIVMVITLVGVSMPIFWLALMLVLQFSVKMNLLPVMGMGDLSKGFGDVVIHMILPGFCLQLQCQILFLNLLHDPLHRRSVIAIDKNLVTDQRLGQRPSAAGILCRSGIRIKRIEKAPDIHAMVLIIIRIICGNEGVSCRH